MNTVQVSQEAGFGRRATGIPIAVRLHRDLPLFVPDAHHGARDADLRPQEHLHEKRQRAIQRLGAVLGQDLRRNVRHGGRYRHPAGVPVRDQLGRLLRLLRRHNRPDPGDGGSLRVLPGVRVRGAVPLRRAPVRAEGSLVLLSHGLPRNLGVGLLHHRDQRLGAAPGRLPDTRERQHRARRLLGGPAQLLDVPAVRAQHGRSRGVWCLRHGGPRSLLPALEQARGLRTHLRQGRGNSGRAGQPLDALPERALLQRAGSRAPACRPRRDGGAVRDGEARGYRVYRPARRRKQAHRQPHRSAACAQLTDLPELERRGEGPRGLPREELAG